MNNYDLINGNCVFNQTSLDLYGSNKRTNAGIDPVPPYRPSDKPAEEEGAIRCNVDNCNACSATNHCDSCQVGYSAMSFASSLTQSPFDTKKNPSLRTILNSVSSALIQVTTTLPPR